VQQAGYAAFESGARVLSLLGALVPALSINAAKVRANIDASCITVTELADTLVRTEGLAFRAAHQIAAQTAAQVIAQKKPLAGGYQAFVQAFQDVVGRSTRLAAPAYKKAVSAENFVAIRDRFGGPAAAPMQAALSGYGATLAAMQAKSSEGQHHLEAASNELERAFDALADKKGDA